MLDGAESNCVAERPIRDASARRTLALFGLEVMDYGLGAELLLEGRALASTLKRRQPPRFGIGGGRFLAQLLLRRRRLLRLGAEHASLECLHRGHHRGELGPDLDEFGPDFDELGS